MKVTPQSNVKVATVKTTEAKPEQAVTSPPAEAANTPRKAKKADKNQQVLRRLFAQIGISDSHAIGNDLDLVKHTSRREQILAANRLRNLQKVFDHALEVNIDTEHAEGIDPDWFFSFAKFAEEIHSPAMQSLWGKIIAVELAQPGSFSLRTLALLKQLTQRDAKLFSKVASVASRKQHDATPLLLVGYYQKPSLFGWFTGPSNPHLNLAHFGITYPDLLALIDMGLIFASEIETGELDPDRTVHWRCGDIKFDLTPKRGSTALIYYKFTSVGSELFRLVNKQRRADYTEQLCELLSNAFTVVRH
ncbi:TIGR03899 family protein [Alteromonas sp. ASW11-36]|uniref:TIGR03899 family protein n=1 Tax=Alteromonas arenosi TaxID=3055817 RepID=A0ABT7SZ16_9ALTE|nr:TIGR03899 family protein [Alteromonas sp. ASW11-36]MDM7861427.1 TIGR03899 family protein [Alteromonas sp. ASW11-36]